MLIAPEIYKNVEQPVSSQPNTAYSSQEPIYDSPFTMQTAFTNDFNFSPFNFENYNDENNNNYFDVFGFQSELNEVPASKSHSIPSNSTKDSPPLSNNYPESSKFGFGFEPLSEYINDLELTTSTKSIKDKFETAKFEIEVGNLPEANRILKEMLDNQEIRYKQLSFLDGNLINGSYTSISQSK